MFVTLILLTTSSPKMVEDGSPEVLSSPEVLGYYSWNWGAGSSIADATDGVAFTGLISVTDAIAGYVPGATWCCPPLVGKDRLLSLGGGNSAGVFTAAALAAIQTDLPAVQAANYTGVVFDVEEVSGSSDTLVPAFASTFAACKRLGLKVVVTTSHSAPYACDTPEDAVAFVKSWAADENIDILSPQLYSSGQEASPELSPTNSCIDAGCTWQLYLGAKGAFVPSLVDRTHYAAVQTWAAGLGLLPRRYYQWRQELRKA